MNPNSAEHRLQKNTSSPESSRPSVSGPSTSPSSLPAAIIVSIKDRGTDIIDTIHGWRQKTPTAEALADVLQSALPHIEGLTNDIKHPNTATSALLEDLNTTLRDVQRVVKAKVHPRKRHVMKGAMVKLLGAQEPGIFPSCQAKVVGAFQALELNLSLLKPPTAVNAPRQGANASHVEGSTPPKPSKSDHVEIGLDTSEKVFQFAVGVGEAIPVVGSILKAVGSIGLTIIKILNDAVNNKEEARSLASYIEDLIPTTERFLRSNGTQISSGIVERLRAFKTVLESVQDELRSFAEQGGFRNGVSHARNKDVLAGCDTQIRRSFTQLQVHLSLDAVRLLTSLGDAEARRERRDLLNLLGDADTGATDKASDPADLMCLEGTRVDVLDQVDRWASDLSSERVLWVNGVAGCGKSVIAATVAGRREEQSATAIFHFARSNQPRNKRVVCSIARQLAKKVARVADGPPEHLVLSSIQADPDIAQAHLSTQFKNLLADPLSKLIHGSPPILIIIDALDEWDNQDGASKLVDLIRQEHGKLPPSIKFLLTSRKESHLSRAFGSSRITSLVKSLALDIAPRLTVDQDIRAYLTKHFDRICSDSPDLSAGSWPGIEALDKLVTLSGGLFQWASTVLRFIEKGSHKARLKEIFARPNQLGDLDALYRLVLTTLLQTNDRPSTPTLLQHVLGSIVVAPIPISLNTLVYLYGDDTLDHTVSDIKEILAALGSLLIVPVHPNEAIRVLHPSIIDFLADERRCANEHLYMDRAAQNRRLALLCLHRMMRDLKRDICGVNDPRKFNADAVVQDLVSKNIRDPLRYACRYWAEHLLASSKTNAVEVDSPLQSFCTEFMLFWFEVMGLTGMFEQAVAAVKMTERWITLLSPDSINPTTKALLYDARRFLLMCSEPISTNAAHIYLSALLAAPSGTDLAIAYRGFATVGPRALAGPIAEYWPSSLWVAARHSRLVRCCAFSPDGRILASGSEDKTLRLWDVDSGVQKGPTLEGHTNTVTCLEFSSNGKILASGAWDRTLCLWDVDSGVQQGPTMKGHTDGINCLAFSSNGKTLASGSNDKTLRLWDIDIGVQKGPTLEGHTDWVNCLAFSPDGKTLASGSNDKTLRLWDVDAIVQLGPTLEGHTGRVSCLSFSSDGRILASGSRDKTLRLWDVGSGVKQGLILEGHTDSINCLAFSSDGRTLASGSNDKTLRLWDADTAAQKGPTLEGHTGPVNCLEFSSDGRILASGSWDRTLRLWDIDTALQKGPTLEGHTSTVSHLAFSSNGRTLASTSWDLSLRLWDVKTAVPKGPTLEGHTGRVNCLAFSSNGRILASASWDLSLRLWDIQTGVQKGHVLHLPSIANQLEFSPTGKKITAKSYDEIIFERDLEMDAWDSPAPPTESAFDTRSSPLKEVATRLSHDGWVHHGPQRWFWIPAAFGRDILGELRNDRFIFLHDSHVCIIDVSDIMYLIE